MGKVGTSADNAMAESFNASLKRETLAGANGWPDIAQAHHEVFAWITRYTRRCHSTCGYLTPAEYENAHPQSYAGTRRVKPPACPRSGVKPP